MRLRQRLSQPDTNVAIDENSGAGQVVYTATATDTDFIGEEEITFSLAQGSDAALTIDSQTGAVTLSTNPDHEIQSAYSFAVVATDAAGNESDAQSVTLTINDLDDAAPTITSGSTATSIEENSGAGQVIYTATADDSGDDVSDTPIRFTLAEGSDNALSIDTLTGAVTLSANPDHESQSEYNFTVVATDGAGNASEKLVSLAINNLDEVAPTITSGETAAVLESSGADTVVYRALVDDTADISEGVIFSLAEGYDPALTIDVVTGEVTLADEPDIQKSPYSFTVIADDGVNQSQKAVTLSVVVEDLEAPVFTSSAAVAIDENIGETQVIYTAVTEDESLVTYSLSEDRDSVFSIDSETGAVTLTTNPDHESQSEYSFTVIATDVTGNTSQQPVSVAINNLDEIAPTITSVDSAGSINENTGAGTVIYTATADDSLDVSAGVTFSLTGDSDSALSIDSLTGAVTLSADADYEAQSDYTFTVIASDGVNDDVEQSVFLDVNNLDDTVPTITSSSIATAINEDTGAGQVIYTASADDSADISGGVTFSLANDSDSALIIDATTGAVTLTDNPDADAQDQYSFTVVATDAAENASSQSVTLNISNVDDTAPIITSGDSADAIDENSGANQVVYTVIADDSGDVSDGVNYSLVSDLGGALSINEVTGEIRLTSDPDFEENSAYSFEVFATDAAGNQSAVQAVTLDINNLDEVAPTIESPIEASVEEGYTGAGASGVETYASFPEQSIVYTAIADDSADVSNGVTFSLEGADAASFSINSNGEVTFVNAVELSYFTTSKYIFSVIATDAANNVSDAHTVTLTVEEAEPETPVVSLVADSGYDDNQSPVDIDDNGNPIISTTNGSFEVSNIKLGATWEYSTDGGEKWTIGWDPSSEDNDGNPVPASTNGSFSIDKNADDKYIDGDYQIDVRVTNAQGESTSLDFPVSISIDNLPPVARFVSADKDNQQITVEYSESFDPSYIPDPSDYTILQNGITLTVTSVAVSAMNPNILVLAIEQEINTGALDFTYRNNNQLVTDLAGNQLDQGFTQLIVSDGYIRGAEVYIINEEGDLELREQVTSDEYGQIILTDEFLSAPENTDESGNPYQVIIKGGVNMDSGAPNKIELTAPAGYAVINPLSTLVQEVASSLEVEGASQAEKDAAKAEAEASVAEALGISIDEGSSLGSYDPQSDDNIANRVVATQIATILSVASSTESADTESAETATLSSLAETISNKALKFSNDVSIQLGTPIDPIVGEFITVEVYLKVAGTVTLGFGGDSAESTVIHGGKGWETLTFDFSGALPTDVNSIYLRSSPDLEAIIDNIKQVDVNGLSSDLVTFDEQQPFTTESIESDPKIVVAPLSLDSETVTEVLTGVIDDQDTLETIGTAVDTMEALKDRQDDAAFEEIVIAQANAIDSVAPAVPEMSLTALSDTGQYNDDFITNFDLLEGLISEENPNPAPELKVSFNTTATDGSAVIVGDTLRIFSSGSMIREVLLTEEHIEQGFFIHRLSEEDAVESIVSSTITDLVGNTSFLRTDVMTVDQTPLEITSGVTIASIDENSNPDQDQVIYTVTVINPENENENENVSDLWKYELRPNELPLSIDSPSGDVRLTTDPDYEERSEYNFIVVAIDVAGNETEQALTLRINNLDDTAPKITSVGTAVTIDENSGENQVVYTATADDSADASDGVTFSLADESLGFSIDKDSGVITTNADFAANYENAQSQSFTVVATDVAGNASQQVVSVAINNLDEVAPTITSGDTAVAIDENSGADKVVYTATADDSLDISAGVTFSLSGVDTDAFSIDSTSGAVTLTNNPDYETQSEYSFTVIASDGVNDAVEQSVTLDINNLDEIAPSITSGDTATAVNENLGAGQVVYTATATDDADTSDGFSFSLADEALGFSIDAEGVVTTNADFAANYEDAQSQSFTVVATDVAGNVSQQVVSVAINNLDEVAPSITSGDTATAINENSGASQVIYTATATDDADTSAGVTFSLTGDSDPALSIDPSTGAVTLSADPDHETQSQYSFTVVASDGVNEAVEQSVTLDINNLDEIAPSITSGDTAVAIDENSGADKVVYTATADDSLDISAGVTFSLSGVDTDAFSIDSTSGAVTLTNNPDYETQSEYSFTVIASDGVNDAVEQSVTLDINNLDEIAPSITSGDTATAVNENLGAGQVVYTATATDDADTSDGFSFSLADEALGFSIDAEGVVTTNADFAANYEDAQSQSFTVVATDVAGNVSQQVVSVAINNLDEVAPSITSGDTATAINENSGASQVIYTATATDDADTSAGVTFSLTGDSDPALSIDPSTGAVTLSADPDHETQSQYSFTVIASDGVNEAVEQSVTLDINNLDEIAPSITSGDTAVAIDENTGADTVIYTATADDSLDISAGVTFSLTGDSDPALSIDPSTGAVTLSADPDHETQSQYSFTVVASDGVNEAVEQSVTLDINNLDEIAPSITSGDTAVAIDENTGASQVIYTATATDDADTSAGVTFSLTGDSDPALSIDPSTGAVTLSADPDHETQSQYSFTVIASDGVNEAVEQSVTLDINNLDEIAPSITSGDTAVAIDENTGASQVIYTATATDDADTSAGVTFSLTGDSDPALSIDPSTGAVTLSADPNHETQSQYSFTVVASDGVNKGVEQSVTLDINNLDEVAPSIDSGDTAVAIDENTGAGQVVYTAISDDSLDISAGVTFSLSGIDAAAFTINEDSGEVTLIADVDYETQSVYSFTVVASDGVNGDVEQSVTLDINNLDEVAPSITSGDTADAIDENSGAGQVVYTATADDTFLLESAVPIPGLVESTQHVYVSSSTKSEDGTQETIVISYNAEDTTTTGLGLRVHFDSSAININDISDILQNDFLSAPSDPIADDDNHDGDTNTDQFITLAWVSMFSGWPNSAPVDLATITFDIDEDAIGTSAINFTASSNAAGFDFDGQTHNLAFYETQSLPMTFSLTGDSADAFSIDSTSGAVTLTNNPDYETQSQYSFAVIASDAAGNESEAQSVTLSINDLDDAAPTITSGDTATAVNENSGADQVVYTATASDTDFNGLEDITFSLADNSLGFSIDADTGVVTTNADFAADYENTQSQSFTVVATDAAGNASEQVVNVAINNLDEVAPSITSGDTGTAVNENSGADQVVYTATASDTDFNGLEDITFSLADNSLGFSIDADTGVVTTNTDFESNYEDDQSQSFTVVTTDGAGNASEQVVSVAINNLDEVAPSITSGDTGTAVNENSGADQVVYTATASDTDFNGAEDITFSLADDSLGFSIDADTGVVTTNADFAADYEVTQSQSFIVVATDEALNFSEQLVSVAINNLDEVAPSIDSGDTATAVDENSGKGQVVYTATASDTDFNNLEDITFSLADESLGFSIDADTGVVTTNDDFAADYENTQSQSFTVVATDAAGNASEQVVSVAINNLDEVAPSITSGDTGTAVDENSGADQVVYTATASDTDFNGLEDITFSLADESLGFSIDASTGVVTTNTDFESNFEDAQSQSFTVVATDAAGNASEQVVNVAINNLDEVAPSITSGDTGTAVNENSGADQVVYTATASDTDFNGLEDITFSLADNSLGFSIDASTGVVTTNTDFRIQTTKMTSHRALP
jgi:hypothetical protein